MPITEKKVRAIVRSEMNKKKTTHKPKSTPTRKRLMTKAQQSSLIKAIGKNKSMKPSSRKAAIRKIRAKKTRK